MQYINTRRIQLKLCLEKMYGFSCIFQRKKRLKMCKLTTYLKQLGDDSKLNIKKVECWKRQHKLMNLEMNREDQRSQKLDLCKDVNVSQPLARLIREKEREKN